MKCVVLFCGVLKILCKYRNIELRQVEHYQLSPPGSNDGLDWLGLDRLMSSTYLAIVAIHRIDFSSEVFDHIHLKKAWFGNVVAIVVMVVVVLNNVKSLLFPGHSTDVVKLCSHRRSNPSVTLPFRTCVFVVPVMI